MGHRIAAHVRCRGNFGYKLAIRSPESKLTVGLTIELIALLMDSAMMPAT
jgi:hypothetical protein